MNVTGLNLFVAFLAIPLTLGCAVNKDQLRAALNENPEIVFDVIEKNPSKFMASVEKASQEARKVAQEKETSEQKNQMEEEMKNPKKPEISEDRAVRGSKTAPVFIVAYSDFQCPYCKRGFETVETLRKKYGDKIGFMLKQLPLDFHPMAMPAAKRFEAIAMQGAAKAYAYHDYVFQHQDRLQSEGEKFLDKAAKQAGANVSRMKKDMESEAIKNRIEADKAEAHKFSIYGTPGYVVAGITVRGAYPLSHFEQIIDERLKGASPVARATSSTP